MRPRLPIPKTKILQEIHKAICLINTEETLRIVVNQIYYIKRIIYYDQGRFISGMKGWLSTGKKKINQHTNYVNRMLNKNRIIPIMQKRHLVIFKTHSWFLKNSQQRRNKRKHSQLEKNTFSQESKTNTILNYEKLKAFRFPLRLTTRQGWPFSPLLFKIVLEVLVSTVRQERKLNRNEWMNKWANEWNKKHMERKKLKADSKIYMKMPSN